MFTRNDLIIAIYVDDALILTKDIDTAQELIKQLNNEFETNKVESNRFLGFEY